MRLGDDPAGLVPTATGRILAAHVAVHAHELLVLVPGRIGAGIEVDREQVGIHPDLILNLIHVAHMPYARTQAVVVLIHEEREADGVVAAVGMEIFLPERAHSETPFATSWIFVPLVFRIDHAVAVPRHPFHHQINPVMHPGIGQRRADGLDQVPVLIHARIEVRAVVRRKLRMRRIHVVGRKEAEQHFVVAGRLHIGHQRRDIAGRLRHLHRITGIDQRAAGRRLVHEVDAQAQAAHAALMHRRQLLACNRTHRPEPGKRLVVTLHQPVGIARIGLALAVITEPQIVAAACCLHHRLESVGEDRLGRHSRRQGEQDNTGHKPAQERTSGKDRHPCSLTAGCGTAI